MGDNHRLTLLGSAAVLAGIAASTGAMAQSCVTDNPQLRPGFQEIGNLAAATASSVAGSIGSLNTVLLTQQTSAFVTAPSGVAPGTQGGGVWVRGLGGEAEVNSTSTTFASQNSGLGPSGQLGHH